MSPDAETRDHSVADMLERITVPQLSPAGRERLAQARGATAPSRAGTSRRRLLLVLLVAAVAAAGIAVALGLALAGSNTSASKPYASTSPGSTGGAETDVRTLLAFSRALNARTRSSLPPGVAEMLSRIGSRLGQEPRSIAEPIVGPPSVYLVTFQPNQLCVALALSGAVWECRVTLQQAGGSLSVSDAIVDGKRFVYGLAANDVTSIHVSSTATATTPSSSNVPAQLANNAFVAPLPYNGGFALGAVTVTVTRADGSTGTVELPGLRGPLHGIGGTMINPATGAPGAADASKKRVLIASKNATLWTAPRSDGTGYCVWTTVLPNGGGSSQCNLPIPPERELGLGLLEESVLEGRVGSDVVRVEVTFADGTATSLKPVEGWVLLGGISPSAEPLTANAYNSSGDRVGTQTLG